PAFIGVTVLAFALIHLIPGDPIEVMMGERGVDPVMHAQAMHRLGLDLPLPRQYVNYLAGALHGDLGKSVVT
ncbi:dipeptide ABC transporter permease DppB, partial [Escherichia coli]|nr:dipeptide ABC transporter permease DppB [Escherichia coli]